MVTSYPLPVCRASVLPAASFRFSLATNILAVRLVIPLVGVTDGLHLPGSATLARTKKAARLMLGGFLLGNYRPPEGRVVVFGGVTWRNAPV